VKNIYVGCPAARATGGPTLTHQLCYKLNEHGYNAKMYYYHRKAGVDPVHPRYKSFNNEHVLRIPDSENSFVIAPETNTNMLKPLKKVQKVIWWMSVDNYFDKFLKSRRNKVLNIMGLLKLNIDRTDLLHFVQSQYAYEFLLNRGIDKNRIYYLSDYLNDIFIRNAVLSNVEKENYVLYNPKKGYEFTRKIIEAAPHIQWKPLENLSPEEMLQWLKKSKVYIDFGNHPGKDRIPREAAICGCCVITGKKGSAKNNEDVKIPEGYKFDGIYANIPNIIDKINNVLDDYDKYTCQFDEYRQIILNEENRFDKDVYETFGKLLQ